MTKKIMLINETDDESRVAIVEDSVLQELLMEHRTLEQTKNNIYKGGVVQIQPSLQAAFVDFGSKKHGFLPSSEINPSLFVKKATNTNSPIQHKLKKGQPLLVQVTREAIDQKGAALTTNISLPGRFMVLMPNSNKGGVSKKIEDLDERERLKSFLSGIDSEKHAVIIRTAGFGRNLSELKKDYTTLKKTWENLQKTFEKTDRPGLVQEEADVITRTLRDYFTEDIEEIWVDNPETFQKALTFIKEISPRRQKDLKLFVGDRSLFSTYKIERQVEQLSSRDVKLASGGSIVIDQTEALVAIDVNSGKSKQEGDIDATALRTNLEAASEVARQLRLRNLGGLIVIDFIDMESEKSRKKVEEELQSAMRRDKAQRKFNSISQFGLLEMSRQRLAIGISRTIESVCPTCNGKGRIPTMLAYTNLIIRSVREMAAKGNLVRIEGELPLELVNHLLNERRQSITDIELEFGINIILRGNPNILVFNENSLRPISSTTETAREADSPPKEETARPEPAKKKGRRKEKESVSKKAVDVEKDTESASEEEAAPADKTPPRKSEKPRRGKKPTASETREAAPPSDESKPAAVVEQLNVNSTIHPACLFTDVKELETDELAEITSSFENRLKGKIRDQAPKKIDNKYLWKYAENSLEEKGEEESNLSIDEQSIEEIRESPKADRENELAVETKVIDEPSDEFDIEKWKNARKKRHQPDISPEKTDNDDQSAEKPDSLIEHEADIHLRQTEDSDTAGDPNKELEKSPVENAEDTPAGKPKKVAKPVRKAVRKKPEAKKEEKESKASKAVKTKTKQKPTSRKADAKTAESKKEANKVEKNKEKKKTSAKVEDKKEEKKTEVKKTVKKQGIKKSAEKTGGTIKQKEEKPQKASAPKPTKSKTAKKTVESKVDDGAKKKTSTRGKGSSKTQKTKTAAENQTKKTAKKAKTSDGSASKSPRKAKTSSKKD
ncbi:MAG: Rne/Rng family ribonuclease [Proteobacteria bacterium]|nr:Rne/Rng family ribonuclease [Pseudomonadota bacterium]